MTDRIDMAVLPTRLFRVSHKPAVFTFRQLEGAAVHRWDDPLCIYRVLYTADQAAGAFIECLGDLRPSVEMLAALEELADNATGLPQTTITSGVIPEGFVAQLYVGEAEMASGVCADVTSAQAASALRRVIAPFLHRQGITDLSGAILQGRHRELTQFISRWVFADEACAGIRCPSYYGSDFVNWSLYEGMNLPLQTRACVNAIKTAKVVPGNADMVRAARTLGLTLNV